MSATPTLVAEARAYVQQGTSKARIIRMLRPASVEDAEDAYNQAIVPLQESKPNGDTPPEVVAAAVNSAETAAVPTAAPVMPDPMPLVPTFLKNNHRWVRWQMEGGTKVPYRVDGRKAASTLQADWTDYRTAVTGATIDCNGGVGFVVGDGIVGFDLDGCRDKKTGDITEWAMRVVEELDAYTEITPSGEGLRVWVRGVLPEDSADKKFNLDLTAGYGMKVGIEVYATARYFTVTGDAYFEESLDVEQRDLNAAYQMLHQIREQYPAKQKPSSSATSAATSSETAKVEKLGYFDTSKHDIFMNGKIVSESPFVVENGYGRIDYPSHSEADLALATILAFKYEGEPEKIDADFRNSVLMREKWNRAGKYAIEKAIATYKEKKGTVFVVDAPPASAPPPAPESEPQKKEPRQANNLGELAVDMEADTVPTFDDSVITGLFREIVDLVTSGTTIPRQFPFTVAKVYFGARMAEGMKFEGMSDMPTVYGTPIGPTGTSKGLSWERTMYGVLDSKSLLDRKVKVLYSLDSGAGLRDAFFEPPLNRPVIAYLDEVRSLGNKADAKKNPEIVDAIIELANGHRVSRQLAGKKVLINETAYLGLYLCGQDGEAFMSSFPSRSKMGLWDRFYPEYSDVIEAGDLPEVDDSAALTLMAKASSMPLHGNMTMGCGAKAALATFWDRQPKEIKTKVRFKSHLILDMYFSAWSQGRMVAEMSDLLVAAKIFVRQMVIRRVHFRGEIPDRVGYYIGLLKTLMERMRKRLKAGEHIATVAMSLRDFQTATNAFRDNEMQVFNTAWRNFERDWLVKVGVKGKNGQTYEKFVPMPYEDEMWLVPTDQTAGQQLEA